MKKIYKYLTPLKNQQGYTLILAVFVIALISILAISLMSTTASTMKQADHERIDQAAYYIAESGITQTKVNLDKIVYDAYNSIKDIYNRLSPEQKTKYKFEEEFYKLVLKNISPIPSTISGFEKNFNKIPQANVWVTNSKSDGPLIYTLNSKGIIGNKNRTVTQEYKVIFDANVENISQNMFSKYVVHVSKNITMSGNAKVIGGGVATESSNLNDIVIPKDIKIDYATPIKVKLPDFPDEEYTNLEKLSYQSNPSIIESGNNNKVLAMTTDMKFDNINLSGNASLTIDVGDTNKKLLVNSLDYSNDINIVGKGKLAIYIKDKFSVNGKGTLNGNTQDNSKVKVFYKGIDTLDFTGNSTIYSSLYSKNSNINISGNNGIQGNIYTGGNDVSISGNSTLDTKLFLAPNATFRTSGNTDIRGVIISKIFEASGNTTLIYDPNYEIEDTSVSYNEPKELTTLLGSLTEK
ncbi:pilus assembly PilX N-terminal domain-containing protein [Rummeliibacillus sp. G93]|uniref:pilus assembly PilX N-terminal domain-containing protein n=1 Tax=Rummeliibacillus sp. G93 TaxID=2939494 RepID=UPI00201C0810|nr:pilus assembly PilX N-terminal domain-containing protein [Rummeliibacillus sp. G93]UQW96384.1 pilus assembly PilX N-terminal domain-containing protein [Rummeliibacillus sp. G93]